MSRRIVEYLPFLGIVLVICTASWLAGRSAVISRDVSGGAPRPVGGQGRTISR